MSQSPLTPVEQRAVKALAAGCTLTAASEASGVHRVTIYRWMKNRPEFQDAVRRTRADFVLARRDQLFRLSTAALFTLQAILENPKSSPAVLLRAAMFILTRPIAPNTGWSMPEPAPPPGSVAILDSSLIEDGYEQLPGLCGFQREAEDEVPAAAPDATSATPSAATAEPPAKIPDAPIESLESTASDPSTLSQSPLAPPPEVATMQHVSPISEPVSEPVSEPDSEPDPEDAALAPMTPRERLKARWRLERDLDPAFSVR